MGMQNDHQTEFFGMFMSLKTASVADTTAFCVREIIARHWMDTEQQGVLS